MDTKDLQELMHLVRRAIQAGSNGDADARDALVEEIKASVSGGARKKTGGKNRQKTGGFNRGEE